MTIDEIIRSVEMVRDDLADADGTACQREILRQAVTGITELKETTQKLCDELDKETWFELGKHDFRYPQTGEVVLVKFTTSTPSMYYLVAKYEGEEQWSRAIDDEPIYDQFAKWKYIN